ncbi:hypothetical protein [Methylorubrum salsuginis]|uniref:hypothetical protein n=1 Tax=Methylorubrum salsuginis TaxID=414703 RepID=UPI001FCDC42E|nr:hypothetical protein [Methylorubrum salsuginis]
MPVPVEGTADALARLEAAIAEDGSAKAWAARVGVSDVYVSDVRRGVRKPGPAVLRALGLKLVVRYEREEALS